jgi:2-polyprenyl-3-methyl-5-hydroxy-6-metoxy-1,4-benzoquinol methylase
MLSGEQMETNQSSQDIADWNKIADQYIQNGAAEDNPFYLQLKEVLWDSLGDLNGLHVLDLGCGDGWLSRLMVEGGATVLGIDGSAQLLEHARSRHPGVEFVQADLAYGIPSQIQQRFDRIVSTMVLMDIPVLDRLICDVRQRLAATGRFIFVILHPCFFQYKIHFDEVAQDWYRKVTNYQDPQVWRIDSFGGHNHYHRNLTYYADLLRSNHLAITRLYEPEWNPQPQNERAHIVRRWPVCLLVEARPLPL